MKVSKQADASENRVPRRVLAVVVASWIILAVAVVTAPTEWSFGIAAVYVTLSGGGALFVAYRAREDEQTKQMLEELTESDWWDARTTAADRMLPAVILLLMLMIQLIVASEALPEDKAEALASLVSIGPVEIGGFQIVAYLIFYWLLGPIGYYFLKRGYRSAKEVL